MLSRPFRENGRHLGSVNPRSEYEVESARSAQHFCPMPPSFAAVDAFPDSEKILILPTFFLTLY